MATRIIKSSFHTERMLKEQSRKWRSDNYKVITMLKMIITLTNKVLDLTFNVTANVLMRTVSHVILKLIAQKI